MADKKRVGIITDSPVVKTGFSTNIRVVLPYLYKTGKYELFHLNQGIDGRSPQLNRFPWNCEGAFKLGTFDINRAQKDEKYKKVVSYGNLAVESWIRENKLDVVIHCNDVWSAQEEYYLKSKWFPKMKDNVLMWTTLDSLPILPLAKSWAANCNNFWVWASFAEKALKEEDSNLFSHVETVPGALDTSEWKPISQNEKQELRKQNNIDRDTTLFIQLGRNQLRKLFPVTIEAFAQFKKKYPNYKTKLLFHTFWKEPSGFPLDRMIKQHGIQDDVLTTYYCKSCGKWEIKSYEGEDIECKFCHEKKAETAGINSTITNKQLAKIYGVADASLSISTSSGLEYTNCQSLLCSLPLLATHYAGSSDFAEQPFVWSLDGTFYYEAQTAFRKHTPNRQQIINFFKQICDMPKSKRKEIGQQGRDWALKQFDVNSIGKILENWIDSREGHGWDFIYRESTKNPQAEVRQNLDNTEYIYELYLKILGRNKDQVSNSEMSHWLKALQFYPREKVEAYFRQEAQKGQEKDKQKKKQTKIEDYLDDTGRLRALISLKESAGDLFNLTSILPDIKNSYKDHDIYVATDPKYFEILKGNTYIYKVIPWTPKCESELWAIGRWTEPGKFSVYINPAIFCQTKLNYLSNNQLGVNLRKESNETN